MAANLLQAQTGQGWSVGGQFSLPMTASAGSTLIGSFGTTGDNPSTVSDDAGNTWNQIAATIDGGAASQRRGRLWYCLNANPITEIAVATSVGNQNVTAAVSEWTGVVGLRGYTMEVAESGATTTDAEPGDLVLGVCYYYRDIGNPLLMPEAGWTSAGEIVRDTIYNSTAYRQASVSGSQGPLWDIGSSAKATITATFVTDESGSSNSNAYVHVGGSWKKADPYIRVSGEWIAADGEPL